MAFCLISEIIHPKVINFQRLEAELDIIIIYY